MSAVFCDSIKARNCLGRAPLTQIVVAMTILPAEARHEPHHDGPQARIECALKSVDRFHIRLMPRNAVRRGRIEHLRDCQYCRGKKRLLARTGRQQSVEGHEQPVG